MQKVGNGISRAIIAILYVWQVEGDSLDTAVNLVLVGQCDQHP